VGARALSRKLKDRGVNLTSHCRLLQRLKINGATDLLPCILSWHGRRQIYRLHFIYAKVAILLSEVPII